VCCRSKSFEIVDKVPARIGILLLKLHARRPPYGVSLSTRELLDVAASKGQLFPDSKTPSCQFPVTANVGGMELAICNAPNQGLV
jgi:hypothetical protein